MEERSVECALCLAQTIPAEWHCLGNMDVDGGIEEENSLRGQAKDYPDSQAVLWSETVDRWPGYRCVCVGGVAALP